MDDKEQGIRKAIFDKVKELHDYRKSRETFKIGESTITFAGRVYDEKEMISLVDCALDFWLTEGRFTIEFERAMSEYLDVKHTVLTNSGSSANLLAVCVLTSEELGEKRLRPGDEVISVAAAFPTTVNPIIQNNLVPVFLDIKIGTYNIDTAKLEEALSERTRAVFIAHALGNPFDLDTIMQFCERNGLFLIEDTCDALGSKYNGRLVGSFGDISTFSFYPPHHITMGEGGLLAANSPLLTKLLRSFRDWGRHCWCRPGHDDTCGKRFNWQLGQLPFGYDHKYIYSHIGYNLKALDLQPAIGLAQLEKLDDFISARRRNFEYLYLHFKKYEDVFYLPSWDQKAEPSWFGFPLTIKEKAGFSRNELVVFLESNKILTRLLFAGNILKQPAYRDIRCRIVGGVDKTDYAMGNTFWVGVYPGLTREMLDYMVSKFDEFLADRI
ncbi:MAG: lipopolysaccharide biosynthesis protein RfbH [Chloroflexi bacterium]|nr:lipopolysaccharide biosynthesis protein RfbH [Chloroflexota bacterium]